MRRTCREPTRLEWDVPSDSISDLLAFSVGPSVRPPNIWFMTF